MGSLTKTNEKQMNIEYISGIHFHGAKQRIRDTPLREQEIDAPRTHIVKQQQLLSVSSLEMPVFVFQQHYVQDQVVIPVS